MVEFPLNQYFTKDSVLDAVDDVTYKKGKTQIGKALNFTRKFSLTNAAGARPLVTKVRFALQTYSHFRACFIGIPIKKTLGNNFLRAKYLDCCLK